MRGAGKWFLKSPKRSKEQLKSTERIRKVFHARGDAWELSSGIRPKASSRSKPWQERSTGLAFQPARLALVFLPSAIDPSS